MWTLLYLYVCYLPFSFILDDSDTNDDSDSRSSTPLPLNEDWDSGILDTRLCKYLYCIFSEETLLALTKLGSEKI